MQKLLNTYKKEGTTALKNMWIAIVVLGIVQVIVSIAVAASNEQNVGGFHSATFAAIWSMFIVILFVALGGKIVMNGKNAPLLVGFMIGVASMLAQLCFMLCAIFFTLGTAATSAGYKTDASDKAYGVFSLFNFIFYTIWAVLLFVHRQSVIDHSIQSAYKEEGEEEAVDGEAYEEQQVDEEEQQEI